MSLGYDELLTKYAGEFGPYQIMLFLLSGLGGICMAFFNVGIVFLAAVPDHWCETPSADHLGLTEEELKNLAIPYNDDSWSKCVRYDREYHNWTYDQYLSDVNTSRANLSVTSCDAGWRYSSQYHESSIVSQWDLVCEKRWLQAIAASIYMAGLMVGVIFTGSISDMLGRKPVLIGSGLCLFLSAILQIFSVNYIMFVAIRFLVGVCAVSVFTIGFVACIEMVGPKWRSFTGIIFEMFWVVGYVMVPLLAYFLRDWQKLQAAFAAPCALYLLYFWIFDESPRWLYFRSRNQEADVIVKRMAKVNRTVLPETFNVVVQSTGDTKVGYIWDLFRTRRMRCRAIISFFIWFVNSFVFYGLSLNMAALSGDPYLNCFLTGIVEVPAYILTVVAVNRIGRRLSLTGSMLFAGGALLLTLAVPKHNSTGILVLVLLGKFSISASFAIIYVITAEIFPTAVRNVAVSSGAFWARAGGVVAPFVGQLAEYSFALPIVVFGVCSLLAGFLSLCLPETKDALLPETLEDGEAFTITVDRSSRSSDGSIQKPDILTDDAETVDARLDDVDLNNLKNKHAMKQIASDPCIWTKDVTKDSAIIEKI